MVVCLGFVSWSVNVSKLATSSCVLNSLSLTMKANISSRCLSHWIKVYLVDVGKSRKPALGAAIKRMKKLLSSLVKTPVLLLVYSNYCVIVSFVLCFVYCYICCLFSGLSDFFSFFSQSQYSLVVVYPLSFRLNSSFSYFSAILILGNLACSFVAEILWN